MSRPTYYKVGPTIWDEPWTDDARYVAIYLLTNRHRTTEGLYRLPLSYVAEDTGWQLDRVQAAITELIGHEFIEYDPSARVVLIVEALKWQSPSTDNHIKGAVRKLETLPETPLRSRFLSLCDTHADGLAHAIRMAFEWDAACHGDGHSHPQALAPPLNSSSTGNPAAAVAHEFTVDAAAADLVVAEYGISPSGAHSLHPKFSDVMWIATEAQTSVKPGDPPILVEDSSVGRVLRTAAEGVDVVAAANRAAAAMLAGDKTTRHFFKVLGWALDDAAKDQVQVSRSGKRPHQSEIDADRWERLADEYDAQEEAAA